MEEAQLEVQAVRSGPDPQAIEAAVRAMLEHSAVRQLLQGTQHRLLSFDFVEADAKPATPAPANAYRATVYDYTNNRSVVVDGRLDNPRHLEVAESAAQPLPNDEEFQEAVRVLSEDQQLGPAIRERRVQPYPSMPPLLESELPDGRIERTLGVGLLPVRDGERHEIVGVNLIQRRVLRFPRGAPDLAQAHNPICGLPNAGQATAAKGTAGTANVTITQGGTVLWRFQIVRPAASSGSDGSGVELRSVDYRGKRVLYRAHVPILNVQYDNNACGPYRDWQWQEGMLRADGTDVAPGIRLCRTPAQTILESGTDQGNFLGVALYVQGTEVVVVSELQAGWYRYISQWRLNADGTIRPRFGFSAVQNSCVCSRHHHQVYWRLDFDIDTPGNNVVREFNDPPIFPGSNWHTKLFEIKRFRDAARKRHWRVENAASGDAYDIMPGSNDGVADSYGKGDLWVLRYRGSEIDDRPITSTAAELDKFVNGESVNRQDVVLWYAAHFTHDVGHEGQPGLSHIVGPDLRPARW